VLLPVQVMCFCLVLALVIQAMALVRKVSRHVWAELEAYRRAALLEMFHERLVVVENQAELKVVATQAVQ
jgi:hypothetical protein